MPDRRYRPAHEPPTTGDRMLAHPTAVAMCAASVAVGVALAIDAGNPGWVATVSLEQIPTWQLAVMSAMLMIGGASGMLGILSTMRRRDLAWLAERIGWVLTSTAWLAFAVASVLIAPSYPVAPTVSLCFTLGGGLRLVALHFVEEGARAKVERFGP